jgi:hypothetical protein
MPIGVADLLAWERNEADGPWQGSGEPSAEVSRPTCPRSCRRPGTSVKAIKNSPGSQVPGAQSREYVVPAVLRGAMFVPWQAPGRREPARVTAGAFKAAGVPVPEHPAQRNIYQLTRRQGLAWTPGLDAHIRRRGGELLGHAHLILVDIDSPAGVDGRPLVDALRWLADRAVEAGELLDLSATVSVRTPGHPASGHLAGWHLWYRADPRHPVHLGPLARCHAIELRTRGTCPGSPGYLIRAHPGELPALPQWIAALAGPPPAPATPAITGHGGAHAHARLAGLIRRLLAARRGERNQLLFWASLRAGELAADGDLDAREAARALTGAATQIGLADEDGQGAVAATIRSGFQRAGATYQPP